MKYDDKNFKCIFNDPLIDICTTPGLNRVACLAI